MNPSILAEISFPFHMSKWVFIPLLIAIVRVIGSLFEELSKSRSRSKTPAPPQPFSQDMTKPVPKPASSTFSCLVVGGYLCAAGSLLFFPPFLGLAGVICGAVTMRRSQGNNGLAIIIVSFVCALIGAFFEMVDASFPAP
jgi:hypothetical protein